MQQVNARSLRTRKEIFYFILIIFASVGVWYWLLSSAYRDFKGESLNLGLGQEAKPTIEGKCFVKNSYPPYDNIIRIDQNQLRVGENCLIEEELTRQECFVSTPDRTVRKVDFGELYTGEACLLSADVTDEQKSLARQEYDTKNTPVGLGTDTFSKLTGALSTPVLLLIFFVFGLFFHLLAMAHVRLNAIKVGPKQLPELFEGVKKLCETLGIAKQPDVFVMNGNGILNAFAARLVTRRLLVVYSDLADALIEGKDQKQLEAVLGHELGHHELGHTSIWNYFIEPGMLVPGIGHAYSRAREYSCDRVMRAVVPDQEACERALIKLAGGKAAGARANLDEYVSQKQSEGGFFAFLAEKLSTHPHLPNRINALRVQK